MISIKRYLDQVDAPAKPSFGAAEMFAAALEAYRATILATAEHASRVCPASGQDLQAALKRVGEELPHSATPEALQNSAVTSEQQLQIWSESTINHLKEKADEVRELLLVLARAGEEIYERDQRYAGKFNEITKQLNSISHLDDLSQIRVMVMKSAAALKSSTAKMAEDGKESVKKLRAQLSSYQERLEEAERIASRDCLTGLRSRLSVEGQIQRRIHEKREFSLVMIDLNGFKQVNDTYGHSAGDNLLRQFSSELSSVSRSSDIVGRWGGDEFLIVVDGALSEAKMRVQRIRDWVCGEYTLDVEGKKVKFQLGAAIGVVESNPADTTSDIVKRADEAMYIDKRTPSRNGR